MTDFLILNVIGKYLSLFELPADEWNTQVSRNDSNLFELLAKSLPANDWNKLISRNDSNPFELPTNEWNKPPGIDNVLYVRWKGLGLKYHAVDREQTLCDVCLNRIPAFYCSNDVCALKHGQPDIDRITIKNAGKARGNDARDPGSFNGDGGMLS